MSKEMQIIAANFETKDGALHALRTLKLKMVKHGKGVVLSKSKEGKVKVRNTFNWGIFAGALVGSMVGDIVDNTGVQAVSALIGGVAGKKLTHDFPKDQLNEMTQALESDHSMIILLTNAKSVSKVENILSELGGQLLSHPISADLMPELAQAISDAEAETEADAD